MAGLRCRLEIPDQLPGLAISPEIRHHVFLAVKEAVTNIVRHAQATEVRLRLRLAPAAFTLEIEDNGRGIPNLEDKAVQSRSGLRNMRKRLEDIHGDFSLTPVPTGGTRISLTVKGIN